MSTYMYTHTYTHTSMYWYTYMRLCHDMFLHTGTREGAIVSWATTTVPASPLSLPPLLTLSCSFFLAQEF